MSNEDALNKAIMLIKQGEKENARPILESILKKDPTNIQAWLWETEVFSALPTKIKVLEACLKQNPENPQALRALGALKKRLEPAQVVTPPPPTQVQRTPPRSASVERLAPLSWEPSPPEPVKSPWISEPDSGDSLLNAPKRSLWDDEDEQKSEQPSAQAPVARPFTDGNAFEEVPAQAERAPKASPAAKPKKPRATPKTSANSRVIRMAVMAGIPILFLCVLIGGYLANGSMINGRINSAYAAKDCNGAAQNRSLVSLYPQGLFGSLYDGYAQYSECVLYLDTQQAIQTQNWEKATTTSQEYIRKYPQGIFTAALSAQSPAIYSNLIGAQIKRENFAAAIQEEKELAQKFPASPEGQAANGRLKETYDLWVASLLEKENYPEAERVLKQAEKDLKNNPQDLEATQNKLIELYISWGDSQARSGDIEGGLKIYGKIKEVKPDYAGMERLTARVQLQKAIQLGKSKNFEAALAHVQEIENAATTDEIKEEVNAARATIYQIYSESNSQQAIDQMTLGLNQACQGQKPALPIFGLDTKNIRYSIPSIFAPLLPIEMSAQTPGQMRYAICIEETETILNVCEYVNNHYLRRARFIWKINLVDVLSGQTLGKNDFKGGTPPGCPPRALFTSQESTQYGSRPDMSSVLEWIKSLGLEQ